MKSRHVCVSKFHTAGELPVQCRSLSLSLPAPIPPPPAMFFQPWSLFPPLLSFLSLSQPLPFPSLTANQFTPFPLFLPTHFHQIFSLPAIIWLHVQTIIHAPAKDLVLHPAPLSCHFCLFFFAFYSRFQRCDDIVSYVTLFTPSLERTLPSNTHSHTQQKRMHPAYNQRKKSHGPSVCWRLHKSEEEWWCDLTRMPDTLPYIQVLVI